MLLLLCLACPAPPPDDSAGGEPDPPADTGDSADPCAAAEVCNGQDDDCDGVVDPDGAVGCVERWTDGDGDGLGGGEPRCVCDAEGAVVGGDCDDGDRDRGAACAEGERQPVGGDRLLHDDPDDYYNFTDVGRFGPAGERALLLWAPGAAVLVAAVPGPGDTPLAQARLATIGYGSFLARPLVGELDGDGLDELVSLAGVVEGLGGGACRYTPEVQVWTGPLAAGPPAGSPTPMAPLRLPACDPTLSAAVADLDGEPGAELWVQVGTPVDTPGPSVVVRVDAFGTLEPLEARDEVAGVLDLVPAGDLDGDGADDLVRVEGADGQTRLRGHPGPLPGLPAAEDAAWSLQGGGGLALRPLPDLDRDGLPELAVHDDQDLWLVSGGAGGELAALAWARVGAEHDGEGRLAPAAADLGAGEVLVVGDTFYPSSSGPGNLRGAVYVFPTPPSGHVDARTAAHIVVGEEFGGFGSFVAPLGDGRLVAGANLLGTGLGTGVTWVFDPE